MSGAKSGSKCRLTINGRTIEAAPGTTLVDAGLSGRILVPHDCLTGQCETCRVRLVSGSVDDRGTRIADTVLACQATLIGDATIFFDEVPPVLRVGGTVTDMRSLAPDIAEVVVALNAPLEILPGQYLNVRFAGFPGRDYSPAPDLEGGYDPGEARLHVRLLPGGIVSGAIGRAIRPGHKAQIRGPLGAAFLRPGSGPLILVSGGTGFAPVWSVARAARLSQPGRDLFLVTGMRRREEVYMESALDWLIDHGALEAFATVEEDPGNRFRPGRPTHYLPSLGVDDTVIVAGSAGLVEAVRRKAVAAGARVHADPFVASRETLSMVGRLMQSLRSGASAESILSPRPQGVSAEAGPLPGGRRFEPAQEPAERRPASIGRRAGEGGS
ncbi:MAG: ferredoxin [Xanthobacteraceae bacterium]|jgi:3-phenylpropionate/trans-cinnamate dioxygenase ferredoxin reductase subunit|nr:ferredoxin [Xanthobacteraceae bacterium]